MSNKPARDHLRKTMGIVVIYFFLSCLALLNPSGGGDIFFATLFTLGIIIHLVILSVSTIVKVIRDKASWRANMYSIGLLATVCVVFIGLLSLRGQIEEDNLTPQERERMHRQQEESERISDIISKDKDLRIGFALPNGKVGFTDRKGKVQIPAIYDDAQIFDLDTITCVKKDGKWGFINRKGKTVIPFIYNNAGSFSGQLAPVARAGLWGYVDRKGQLKIPFQFEKVEPFSEKLAAVSLRGKWGYINERGEFAVQPKYDRAYDFHQDTGYVELGESSYKINRKGLILRNIKPL